MARLAEGAVVAAVVDELRPHKLLPYHLAAFHPDRAALSRGFLAPRGQGRRVEVVLRRPHGKGASVAWASTSTGTKAPRPGQARRNGEAPVCASDGPCAMGPSALGEDDGGDVAT